MANLALAKSPCCCDPENGIACETALEIMNQVHESVRQMTIRANSEAYVSLKEQLRQHYLEREGENAKAI